MPRPTPLRLALLTLFALPLADAAAGVCPPLPADMRAAVAHSAGGPEVLQVERVALPTVMADEVLVLVRFASINPVDWKLQQAGRLPLLAIPGGDFSGVVVAVGERVAGVACGDSVAGGQLRVNIDRVYPLAEIRAAQQHNRDGHTRGKVVVSMAPDAAASAL